MKRKIAFVTHEFGLFAGHGGVASYLDVLVSKILERTRDYEVFVLTLFFDKKSKLLKDPRLHIITILGNNEHEHGKFVLEYLKKIRPDFVECTDYLSLCLEALTYRAESTENELSHTVFITLHHTASRECFEWNDRVPVRFAPYYIQECCVRERTQMKLSDLNVAPSSFMQEYVTKNYALSDVELIPHPIVVTPKSKEKLLKKIEIEYDLNPFKGKFVINCISRIEGRKGQGHLIQQFVEFLRTTNADAYLIIVGNSSINSVTDTDFKIEFYEMIPDEYKHNILFFDFMNSVGKERIFAVSDLSVLASPFECLSLAMAESVAYEVPVICSKYCGFADYMEHSRDLMTFDPFRKNSLSDVLVYFYGFNRNQRNSILKSQKEGLNRLSAFSESVDRRLRLYENIQIKSDETCIHNTLVIDEQNYLDLCTKEICSKQYDSILVDFYFKKSLVLELLRLFHKVCDRFSSGDIIGYTGNHIQTNFINLLSNRIPFFICKVKIDESFYGKPLFKIISNYASSSTPVFNLLDEQEGLVDSITIEPSEMLINRYNDFLKRMIAMGFYVENLIDLEKKVKTF